MTPEEAYEIAKEFHRIDNMEGEIPSDINKAMYLDEENHITEEVTWMIRVKLPDNPFEGMDELTIMVSDSRKKVCQVLDDKGSPSIYYRK